jgi:hypothetical protein
MDIDAEELEHQCSAPGIPGYFNTLAPKEDEEFEIRAWRTLMKFRMRTVLARGNDC